MNHYAARLHVFQGDGPSIMSLVLLKARYFKKADAEARKVARGLLGAPDPGQSEESETIYFQNGGAYVTVGIVDRVLPDEYAALKTWLARPSAYETSISK